MADICDVASELEERQRQSAAETAMRRARADRLIPISKCHNCGEPLPDGKLFCDADCRADHEQRMRAQRY